MARPPAILRLGAVWLALVCFLCGRALAQGLELSDSGDAGTVSPEEIEQMLRVLEETDRRIEALERQAASSSEIEGAGWSSGIGSEALEPGSQEQEGEEREALPFFVKYDEGFVIRPRDSERHPFELKINGRMQFRHTLFDRDDEEWTDLGGNVHSIRNRNDFEIERGRLIFSGFFMDPALQFYLQIDGDTDDEHFARFHDYWVNYEFSEAFNLHAGKAYVPGSREWLNGSTRTRLADRSMATTFFRPDRTVGVWASGEVAENFHYRTMVGNTFNAPDVPPTEFDDQFVYAGSVWWDPWGDFGDGFSDLECHCDPVVRLGTSATFASQHGRDASGEPLEELNFARLSDGTPVVTTGALGPGATVDGFDVWLLAFDVAGKYCGFSFNGEVYLRQLNDFSADAPLDHGEIFDKGFVCECGYFVVPRSIEVNGRVSGVDGPFGDGWEYAGGVNWFINGTHNNKLTIDVTSLHHNPANSSSPNLTAGDDGLLVRTQWQVAF